MSESILVSTKKVLGLDASYTVFDVDVLMHINSTFSTLTQLGLGPPEGFSIEDDVPTWDSFIDDDRMNSVKSYMYLQVRLLFDPPTTSFAIEAMEKQIREMGWRLNVVREGDEWTDPEPDLP